MEDIVILGVGFGGLLWLVFIVAGRNETRRSRRATKPRHRSEPVPGPRVPADRQKPDDLSAFDAESAHPAGAGRTVSGRAYIVDGDTVVICKTQIRLFGIDAPELNHPYGKKAKWELVRLCKGQDLRAEIVEEDGYGRTVARCYLPDGRDLSAEMVKLGLAIDWPKFSNGRYGALENPGIRKKLWLADARQKGRMHVWEAFEARERQRRVSR